MTTLFNPVFMKVRRSKVITVTYNTEHDVRYRRLNDGRASARSVATRIAQPRTSRLKGHRTGCEQNPRASRRSATLGHLVFDVQSDVVGRFTDSDINIQTTLAAQVATSVQNVRSFEQSKKQAELESLVNTIGQRIQRAASIEETLQTAIRELGMAIGASRVKVAIGAERQNSGNTATAR